MILIPLTQGLFAEIDDDDYAIVSRYKWHAKRNSSTDTIYAYTNLPRNGRFRTAISMHRLLLNFPAKTVDHRDGNGLNNRRHNLREATRQQQKMNSSKRKGLSRFKGVTIQKGKWQARIRVNGKLINLGRFINEEDASRAYKAAATKFFGEFARTNSL